MAAALQLRGLVAGYRQPLLGPLTLNLQAGIYALLGRNGAGKTTLMRTVAGVLPPLSGSVTLPAGGQVGYLGHRAALSEGLSVEQNLKFWQRVSSLYAQPRSLEALSEEFGLHDLLPRKVRQLSRGQRQRTDLARLGLVASGMLLLDEPLTGLDPVQARQIRLKMREWSQHAALVYSTHSLPEALELADHFLLVQGGSVRQLERAQLSDPAAQLLRALEGEDV